MLQAHQAHHPQHALLAALQYAAAAGAVEAGASKAYYRAALAIDALGAEAEGGAEAAEVGEIKEKGLSKIFERTEGWLCCFCQGT